MGVQYPITEHVNKKITESFPADAELDSFCGRTEFLPLVASKATSSSSADAEVSGCIGLGRNLEPVLETLNEIPIAGILQPRLIRRRRLDEKLYD